VLPAGAVILLETSVVGGHTHRLVADVTDVVGRVVNLVEVADVLCGSLSMVVFHLLEENLNGIC
jgi:hypothetical protein